MKKYVLFAILAVCALSLRAEFNRLVLRTLDGTEQSVGLSGLKITFVDGELVAVSEEASVTVPVEQLASMEFDNGVVDGLDVVAADGPVAVYSVDGLSHGAYPSKEAAAKALPAGMYIIKSANGLTTKMMIEK